MQNAKGKFVDASLDSVSKAAQGITLAPDLRVSITNSDNPEAYPISGFTWILAYQEMPDQAKALALTRYLWWSVTDGQAFTKDLGYAPLPTEVAGRAQEKIRSITSGGTAVLPKG
jgi:phosphate transport system substrate-binding protein